MFMFKNFINTFVKKITKSRHALYGFLVFMSVGFGYGRSTVETLAFLFLSITGFAVVELVHSHYKEKQSLIDLKMKKIEADKAKKLTKPKN